MDLGITEIVGTATKRDLLEQMVEHGIDFTVKDAFVLSDVLSPTVYLRESTLAEEASINIAELSSFFQETRSPSSIPCMKLSCGTCVPLGKTPIYLQNPYITYPESPQRFTLQFHVRGLSVHGDLRMTISKSQAIGWTLDAGKSLVRVLLKRTPSNIREEAGITDAHLKDLPLRDLSKKLNTAKGRKLRNALRKKVQELPFKQIRSLVEELWKDEFEPILKDPNKKILTQKKASMSPVWLDYEQEIPAGAVGATKELEGQLVILDKGTVEFGAQKPFFHEYFIKGAKIGKRRMVVRRIPTRKSWGVKESFAWLTFFTKGDDLPYTISRRAVTQGWTPPKGVSALPQSVKGQIPQNLQFWRAKNPKAVQIRLVDEIKAKRVPIKLEASLQFAVKRVWHRGPEVRRGVPITRYWLILHDGSKAHDAFDFGRGSNPLEGTAVARRRIDADLKELIPTTGELKPTHSASRVKKIRTQFDTSDSGKIRILEDSNNRLMLRFDGKTLKGTYALIRESPSGETWIFQQAELPEEKKAMLLADPRRIIHCGTNDINVRKRGQLLILDGPAIKPGEVIPMDGEPSYFTKEGIKAFWPSMYRQPIVILHGELKGDVVGFVDKLHYDERTGWGMLDSAVIWHPGAIELVLNKTLASYSIEVLPETIWDPEHQHNHVIGGKCIGLSIVPKGACPTCNPVHARMGTITDLDGKVYKFGMTIPQFLEHNYYALGRTTSEVGDIMGIPRSTVENWMSRYEIPRRDLTEARRLRSLKEKRIKATGGRAIITALGTGAFTDICKEGREDSPQCQEYKKGGKSRRNYTATLFSIGNEHLLINAPRGILDMLGAKRIKPKFILIEHIHEDVIGGLHELRGLKPAVFATRTAWAYLRKHYRALSGQRGDFNDIYNFKRYILEPEKSIKLSSFEATAYTVKHAKPGDPDALGFRVKLGEKNVWHASDVLSIPNRKEALKEVDIFIGDGASLRRGVKPGHTSMEEQIKWAQEADIPKIFFTQIGHVGKTHDDLNEELQGMAPNTQALHDGAEISLGGSNPFASLSESLVAGLLTDKVKVLIRTKPYSEYARQAILMGTEGKAHALYVEGFPEKMAVKDARELEHGLSDDEWKALVGDQENVWVYHPRILKRFEPAREIRARESAGPYIHDAELIEP
jgi:phosphoribosyl 1,2-cyclic phosphodiesterase